MFALCGGTVSYDRPVTSRERPALEPAPKVQPPRKLSGNRTGRQLNSEESRGPFRRRGAPKEQAVASGVERRR